MAVRVPDPFSSFSSSPPLWKDGPSVGGLYSFPGTRSLDGDAAGPTKRTLYPTVTGTSVLGLTFDGGVMLAADTLGSYGSLARFRSVSRLKKLTDTTVIAATGDYADFQHLQREFESIVIKSDSLDDGHKYSPENLFNRLTRLMYFRRCRFNPLWNTIILGGYKDGKPFLGYVNSVGTAFEAPTLASGLGSYMAQPLLREAYEKNSSLTRAEAKETLERALKILFYRDCRALSTYDVAVVTEDGVEIEGPLKLDTNWDVAHYVRGYD